MARYVISLTLPYPAQSRVTREVIRADDNRAILYAQNWLHQSRLSTRVIWQWWQGYTVEEVRKDGETRHVESGHADNRECYVAGYRNPGGAARNGAAKGEKIGRFGVRSGKGKPADARADYLPIRRIGARKSARQPRELSPFQQKLRAAVETAKLRAGSHGNVSRMGSDTDD